jgi:hypothetical protein
MGVMLYVHLILSMCVGNMFEGHETNTEWVASVTTISSPLNGGIMVYSLGANVGMPPIVRVASFGYCVSCIVHLVEYFDIQWLKQLYDFKMTHWNLRHNHQSSLFHLIRVFMGICIHTATDNSAYDMTVHSQLVWNRHLRASAEVYYLSIVGTNCYSPTSSSLHRFFYLMRTLMIRVIPSSVQCGTGQIPLLIKASDLIDSKFDGMLYSLEQGYPSLARYHTSSDSSCIADTFEVVEALPDNKNVITPGKWYVLYKNMDHVGVNRDASVWATAIEAILIFDSLLRIKRASNKLVARNGCAHFCTSGDIKEAHMQIPIWTGKLHSDLHSTAQYKSVVVVVLSLILYSWGNTLELSTWLAFVPLLGVVILSVKLLRVPKELNSEVVEMLFASARCLCCFSSLLRRQDTSNGVAWLQLVAFMYLAEVAVYYLGALPIYDYCTPISKLVLCYILESYSVSGESYPPVTTSSLIYPLLITNMAALLSFGSWWEAGLSVKHMKCPPQHVASDMWRSRSYIYVYWMLYVALLAASVICLFLLPINSGQTYSDRVFCCFVFWILWQKFRCMSEAYQLVCISNRWLYSM